MDRRVLTGRLYSPELRWWALVAMSLGLLSINLDFTVVNVALPDLQHDLETSVSDLQWVINAYTLTLAPGVVIAGRLGDIYGRRRLFLAGTAIFALAAAAAAFSPDVGFLIGARAVQGIGAATLYSLSLAIIGDVFPAEERGRALGVWAGVSATAIAGGPLVGGVVVETLGWRYIFVLLIPFAAGCIALTARSVPESRDEETPRSTDLAGAALAALWLTALVFLFIESRAWGWLSARSAALAGIVAVGFAAFVLVERRRTAPLVDLSLFRSARFLGANVTSFVLPYCIWALLFFQPLFFQRIRGDSAFLSGVVLLPATVTWGGLSLVAGSLIRRWGTRLPMAAGIALVGVGMLLQAVRGPTAVILLGFLIAGIGVGISFAPMTAAALDAVSAAKAGMASGLLLMSRMIGATLGVATAGALFQSLETHELHSRLSQLSRAGIEDVTHLLSGSEDARSALRRLPAGEAAGVLADARDAFGAGLTGAMALGAAVAALGAVLVFFLGRRQEKISASAATSRSTSASSL